MNKLFTLEKRQAAAEKAGLTYVSDDDPGFTRQRWGKGFTYRDEHGEVVRDNSLRKRFEEMAIPPAWTDVWICKQPHGHLQVTGRDTADRKQFMYHERWEQIRARQKYERLRPFGKALPRLREQYDSDLRARAFRKRRVSALATAILDVSHVRIGTADYADEYNSHGLTTLLKEHIEPRSTFFTMNFIGKAETPQSIRVDDRRLSSQLKKMLELSTDQAFCYEKEDGSIDCLSSEEVNEYISNAMGSGFSAKDFRTWGGTVVALEYLLRNPPTDEDTGEKRAIQAVDAAADHLGNTRAVARSSYVDPLVLEAAESEELWDSTRSLELEAELKALRPPENKALQVLELLGQA